MLRLAVAKRSQRGCRGRVDGTDGGHGCLGADGLGMRLASASDWLVAKKHRADLNVSVHRASSRVHSMSCHYYLWPLHDISGSNRALESILHITKVRLEIAGLLMGFAT